MKNEIDKNELKKFTRDGAVFSLLLLVSIVSAVPLTAFLGYYGLAITGVLFVISMVFALKIEKYKKSNDIQTFKEILLFSEGKQLDEIEKAQEYVKRPYQTILSALACAAIAFVVSMISIWLLKSYIF